MFGHFLSSLNLNWFFSTLFAKVLATHNINSVLADTNWESIRLARMDNLNVYFGNPASSHAENNLELAAKLERDIDNLIGFDKEESQFNADKLKAQQYEITVPKSMEKMIMALLSKGSVDLNNFAAQEIPYEDVPDGK